MDKSELKKIRKELELVVGQIWSEAKESGELEVLKNNLGVIEQVKEKFLEKKYGLSLDDYNEQIAKEFPEEVKANDKEISKVLDNFGNLGEYLLFSRKQMF
jgi:hypothetical protein